MHMGSNLGCGYADRQTKIWTPLVSKAEKTYILMHQRFFFVDQSFHFSTRRTKKSSMQQSASSDNVLCVNPHSKFRSRVMLRSPGRGTTPYALSTQVPSGVPSQLSVTEHELREMCSCGGWNNFHHTGSVTEHIVHCTKFCSVVAAEPVWTARYAQKCFE